MRITYSDSPNFIAQKNAATNKPIWLYRVAISDILTEDLFLAEYDVDVYFASDVAGTVSTTALNATVVGSGTSWSSTLEVGEEILIGAEAARYTITAITDDTHIEVTPPHPLNQAGKSYVISRRYLRFPATHEGIGEDTDGTSDTISVNVANASREIQAHLELRDGLIGRTVTIRQVFADYLNDPTSYIQDQRHIDSVEANVSVVKFTLSSKLDLLEITVPRRKFMRGHCGWEYATANGGCWPSVGAPASFRADSVLLHAGEVSGLNIFPLYLGTVSAETSNLSYNAAEAKVSFAPVSIPELDENDADLIIDLRFSDPTQRYPGRGQIEITSSGTYDAEEWAIPAADIDALVITDIFQQFTIPLLNVIKIGTLNKLAINFLRWYEFSIGRRFRIQWRNAFLRAISTVSMAPAKFRAIDCKGLTKANGTLSIELKCNQPTKISALSQIEITSSGSPDIEEWALVDLTGAGWNNETQSITAAWQTFTVPMAAWATTGGELDVSAVNFLRVYALSTDATPLSLDWRNASLTWDSVVDACDKTRRHCRWHGNAARYGGFPGIPSRRTSRE
ncbi:MAG TPA: hypothetical protein VMW24_05225 [Sedimentisphaerales bacterium]|nr:hypothetical protein [Sedimentisphaerales bacterium]